MLRTLMLSFVALGLAASAYASERVTQSSSEIYGSASYGSDCGAGGCGGGKHGAGKSGLVIGWFGHMPQTCYSPRYGCYYGNNRHMHRYPAFHGTYYRRPYNYRNLFDYPWHAEMHEPTSMFSYNVGGEELGPASSGIPQPPPPVIDSASRGPMTARQAAVARARHDITHPSARPATTLRR